MSESTGVFGSGASVEAIQRMFHVERGEESRAAGTVGIISQDLSRFSDFSIALLSLIRPITTKFVWRRGMDVTGNYNGLIEQMAGDWLWIMGDDHTFAPDILMNLLAHDVDIVVPLCLKKNAPFDPVVYGGELDGDDGLSYHQVADLPQHGLAEVYAAGTAGMLIRRHVLDAIGRPVFTTSHGVQNEDLLFCRKAREAGFRIFCDVDQRMGHIGVFASYPMWQGDRYGAIIDLGNGQFSPVYAFTAEDLDAIEEERARLDAIETTEDASV